MYVDTPAGRKRAPIVLMMLPYVVRARATYGSIMNTIEFTFLPSCGLLPAKTVKSNAKCIIHMV